MAETDDGILRECLHQMLIRYERVLSERDALTRVSGRQNQLADREYIRARVAIEKANAGAFHSLHALVRQCHGEDLQTRFQSLLAKV